MSDVTTTNCVVRSLLEAKNSSPSTL